MEFNGRLNSNEIFASLYNAIISIRTFADNISISESLVNSARQDGTCMVIQSFICQRMFYHLTIGKVMKSHQIY